MIVNNNTADQVWDQLYATHAEELAGFEDGILVIHAPKRAEAQTPESEVKIGQAVNGRVVGFVHLGATSSTD